MISHIIIIQLLLNIVALWCSVKIWLWGQEVPGSSPSCAVSSLNPWYRPFTCVKRILTVRTEGSCEYAKVMRPL